MKDMRLRPRKSAVSPFPDWSIAWTEAARHSRAHRAYRWLILARTIAALSRLRYGARSEGRLSSVVD